MTLHDAEQHLSLALEAAVTRFASMVRQVGRRHRLEETDLDEVLQEVRLRLWRARGTSEQIGEAGASYVYRTAVSASLDILRRRRARRAADHDAIDDGGTAELLATPAPGPLSELEGTELAERVAAAIDTIPASRRPVVRMHLQGYPREEIAELMGWTEGKTRNLLYRGLADLRDRLTEQGIGWGMTEEAAR